MFEGKIISISSLGYEVITPDRKRITARVRGSLVHKVGTLCVGDEVRFDEQNNIVELKERINKLIRPRVSNVTYGAVICSTVEPDFSSFLLDKYLTYLLFCKVKPLILFTKLDRLSLEKRKKIEDYSIYYKSLGFASYMLSTKDLKTFSKLRKDIEGKTTVFMGQTGAGKSSAINAIDPDYNRDIGEYSPALGRGKHKTKEVVLLPFGEEGLIGDTPGFSSLELYMTKDEISRYFPGFITLKDQCYFSDCIHINEKLCKVKDCVKSKKISEESYNNYLRILKENMEDNNLWKR